MPISSAAVGTAAVAGVAAVRNSKRKLGPKAEHGLAAVDVDVVDGSVLAVHPVGSVGDHLRTIRVGGDAQGKVDVRLPILDRAHQSRSGRRR
jgi:hypothetical protein